MNNVSRMTGGFAVRLFVVSIFAVSLIIAGCGSSSTPTPPAPITVTISPSATQTLDQTKTVAITATLTNDTKSQGVTWALVGAGSLTSTTTSTTYTAPTTVTTASTATVTATSIADTTKASSPLTINLVVPPTITTLSSSFTQGNVGIAFSGTVTETGGVAPYTWAVTSGPSWLSVSTSTTSTATLQGTPNAAGNPVPITVKVTDSQGLSFSANLNLVINAAIANACLGTPGGHESLLAANSQYAFFAQGFHGPSAGTPVAVAGSISTDGTGKVTGGEEDINSASGPQHLTILPANSFYTVGADNRGCLMLTFSGTNTTGASSTAYHFAVGGVTAGVASKGRIIEFDDASGTGAGTRSSGIIRLQDKTSFALTALHTRYAFGVDGMDFVGAHVAMGGAFTVDTSGNITAGFLDVDDGGALQSAVSGATGTIATTSTTATTGRETATMSWTSAGSHSMSDAIYMVNANEFFIVEIDTLAVGKPITAGRAIVTGSTFTNAGLNSNVLIHTSGASVGAANVSLGILTLNNGALNGTITNYSAAGGMVNNPISGGTYAVDPNSGRITLGNVGTGAPVLYVAAPAANTEPIATFIVGTDGSATFGLTEIQPAATYSPSSLSGNFVIGTEDPADNTAVADVGVANVVAVPTPGTFSATEDFSDNTGILQVGLLDTETLTVTANGTMAFVSNTVFGITNGTKIFFVQAEPGSAAFIVVIEQQ
jgi:hypothetical protein